ncbi:MAG TPA: 2-phosphosulfolactate phosphatase, partial [Clostridia bacterium]|nr:2-phosphosulfolactate phosphatase [Clostridia bacterium]
MEVSVCPVPLALRPEQLSRATAVVIDVLRMTSVAITALSHGCAGILAVETVEEARSEAAACGALLGGERGAVRIDGFDLDNSPLNYTADRVSGRRLIMTTSNGTRALAAARPADRVLLAGFINVSAVAEALGQTEKVCLLCAGTHDAFSLEDALTAGAILDRLPGADLDDMALASLRLY